MSRTPFKFHHITKEVSHTPMEYDNLQTYNFAFCDSSSKKSRNFIMRIHYGHDPGKLSVFRGSYNVEILDLNKDNNNNQSHVIQSVTLDSNEYGMLLWKLEWPLNKGSYSLIKLRDNVYKLFSIAADPSKWLISIEIDTKNNKIRQSSFNTGVPGQICAISNYSNKIIIIYQDDNNSYVDYMFVD